MILLWFILGIVLILGIARYNESNKLFWTLLFCFVMGFAGTKMILDIHHGNEQRSNDSLTVVYPTQKSIGMVATTLFQTSANMMAVKVTASNSVGQDSTPKTNKTNITPGKISKRTRDQPILTLIKLPKLCLQKSFSTPHDYG